MNLIQKKCVACEGGMSPLNKVEAEVLLKQVPDWQISADSKKISREFQFSTKGGSASGGKDFKEAMEFVNKVAAIAESEGHHPDIHIFYNKVKLELWTHAIGGLSENDFIVAAKANIL